jgi:glycosyltransferase involved in cell wall biosynthesis
VVGRLGDAGIADPPPVTVVIPAFREDAAAVRATVEPLLAQLGPDDEVVVVHDPSSDPADHADSADPADDTGAVLDALAAGAPRPDAMRVLHRPAGSSGISSARNEGIRSATHDRIACTDIGCVPQPGWVEALRAALAEAPAPSLATGLYDVGADGPLQEAMALACYPAVQEARRAGPLLRLYGALFGRVFDPALPTGRSMAFTRDAWQSAGGFPEALATAEDVGFGQKIVASGGRAVLAADAVVRWEQRPSLAATARMFFNYGVGDGESRSRLLVGRNLARAAAYGAGAVALARGGRALRGGALAGAAFYLSAPLGRARRRRAGLGAVALVPVAVAVKDGAKVAGCVVGLRRPPVHLGP